MDVSSCNITVVDQAVVIRFQGYGNTMNIQLTDEEFKALETAMFKYRIRKRMGQSTNRELHNDPISIADKLFKDEDLIPNDAEEASRRG